MLNEDQKNALEAASLKTDFFLEEWLDVIKNPNFDLEKIPVKELVRLLNIANVLYRAGHPVFSDQEYDHLYLAQLKKKDPENKYLDEVEPEPEVFGKTVPLPVKMLSTDKAYSLSEVESWLDRLRKSAIDLGKVFNDLDIKITPKLDGFAAYDDGNRLYTRGDGKKGTDITRVFQRGLQVAGDGSRGKGAGEIVVSKEYFETYLSDYFEHPRNFQASVVKEKDLEEHAALAIKEGAAKFYPFSELPSWIVKPNDLLENFDNIIDQAWDSVDYDVDGVVLEATDLELKNLMGATRHHYRWQLAFKRVQSTAEVEVLRVTPQTSRVGRVTPVLELEPTRLSGATIQRATAHHYGMVRNLGIGPGARIELTRSGEVIPKVNRVIKPVEPQITEFCPSCDSKLVWDGDNLFCLNKLNCSAQITNTIEHFFSTLRNNDGFGQASIKRFYENGITSILGVYRLDKSDYVRMGFGDKQSDNFILQLQRSRSEAVEDWRFLAAFGVLRMGLGNCEKLLQHVELKQIFNLQPSQIAEIEGFAEITANVAFEGFQKIRGEFEEIYNLKFNIEKTKQSDNHEPVESPISGKTIVFTGSMVSGSRDDMQSQAKKLGARVGSSVSSKTDILVTGDSVGESKIASAKKHNVIVMTEREYLDLFSSKEVGS